MPRYVVKRPAYSVEDVLKNLNIPDARDIKVTEIPNRKNSMFPHKYKISFIAPSVRRRKK